MRNAIGGVLIGAALLIVPATFFWFGLSSQGSGRVALFSIASVLAAFSIALLFGMRVLVGIFLVVLTAAALAGSIWLAMAPNTVLKVFGFIFGYLTWLAFSGLLLGTPVIIIPLPPFFVFAWQKLSHDQKQVVIGRLVAIGILAIVGVGVYRLHAWQPKAIPGFSAEQKGDEFFAEAILNQLIEREPGIRNLKVHVDSNYAVTLSGVALDDTIRARAEVQTKMFPHVRQVINDLRVE